MTKELTATFQDRFSAGPQLEENAPWKQRYRTPRIRTQIALANPDRILVFSNKTGKYEIYGLDLSKKPLSLDPITDRSAGTVSGYISPDGRYVYYLDDEQGNETGHFVRVAFETRGVVQDVTPTFEKYTAYTCSVDRRGGLFGFTFPTREGFDTYVVEIGTDETIGEPRKLNRSKKIADGPMFSSDGRLSIVVSAERLGGLDFSLISFNTNNGEKLQEVFDESSRIDAYEFSPIKGDYRVIATTTASGAERPFIWNAKEGNREDLRVGSLEGDVVPLAWSPDAKEILLCQIHEATHQLYIYDLDRQNIRKIEHPSGTFDSARFRSEDEVLLRWQNSTNPAKLIALNTSNSNVITLLSPDVQVPATRPWKSIRFRSSDGQEIQGWLALPEERGPFPTIFETHGGPTAAQFDVFFPSSQMWLDHGFAYFTINYRGSTTFGRDFEKKINGDLGHWEVEDMVAGRNWLIENRISIPSKIFLTGWSYGGYLTLQAMGMHPELWAGGAGGVVVADWVTQYEDESDSLRGYDIALFGGPPNEKLDVYTRASPITYVERLSSPILIIQGRNDTRDPPRQVELYEQKARSLGKDVRVEWFETGHTGTLSDIRLAIHHQEVILRFFYEILNKSKR